MNILLRIFCLLTLATNIFADGVLAPSEPPAVPKSPIYSVPNKVEGLELPEPVTVDPNEGFMLIQAKSKGQVKWFVIGNSKVKFVANDVTNSLIVSVPPSGVVNVFAIALADGKLTEFARTDITIKGTDPVKPDPIKPDPVKPVPVDPEVTPEKVTEGIHVTFLTDYNQSSPEIASVLNSKEIRDIINNTKSFYKVYDINSKIVKEKNMDTLLKKTGNTLFVVQKSDGTVLYYSAIPKTDADVIKVLNKITKGE